MCSENEELTLRHKSGKPAITIPRNLSEEDLAFDWSLSKKDIELILSHRGNENICRFAVQLCILKKYGRFLSNYTGVPPAVLGYLCQQLELDPVTSLTGFLTRENTESDYQNEIANYLGWKPFDKKAGKYLREWIYTQVSEHLYIENLIEKAENFLRQNRIIIPGPVTLEREVNSAYRDSEKMVFKAIADQIPNKSKLIIDNLLATSDRESQSELLKFAEYPPEAKAKHIVRYLKRNEELNSIGIEKIRFVGVSSELLQKLANIVNTYDAWQIRRLDSDRKYAIAACFLYETRKTVLDYLVAMHAQFMTTMERKARNAWEKEYQKLKRRAKRATTVLKKLAINSLTLKQLPNSTIDDLFTQVDAQKIEEAIQDSDALETLVDFGYLEELHARYSNFRRYFRLYVELNFACEPGREYLLEAIKILRELNSEQLKELPPDVDISFVPAAWKKTIEYPLMGIDRKTWEIALAMELKEACKSADVFLPESRNHIAFCNLGYNPETWVKKRDAAYVELGLPLEGKEAIKKLVEQFHQTASLTENGLPFNHFVEISHNRFKVRREEAFPEPDGTEALRQFIHRGFSKIRLERLLMEVDVVCGFSKKFTPPGSDITAVGSQYKVLMAAIVALATNLGISVMSNSTSNDITVHMLQEIIRTRLRDETIRAANTLLVDYHHTLKTSLSWGDGSVSSSDGQRFAVQESSLLTALYPRYFGYYERIVTLYTHISDLFSVFSTQAISCAEREALYVLNGILQNESTIQPYLHFTDTHGYTDQIFGLCCLLGLSFMPRISKFQDVNFYKPPGDHIYQRLNPIFTNTVDLDLIIEQWDPLVRIIASLKNRIVSSDIIVHRLANSSGRLAKALSHMGKLVKTTYLLRYVNDPELRRMIECQLNRGEARNGLARHVFFANWGQFRSGDYFKIMNQASCLSLVSNAILIYNTLRIGEMLEKAQSLGMTYTPDMIARISPLHHEHIIVNGMYDFSNSPPI